MTSKIEIRAHEVKLLAEHEDRKPEVECSLLYLVWDRYVKHVC